MESGTGRGSIDEAVFPQLLLHLHAEGFTGALWLRRERVEKKFLLRDGIPLIAESNLSSEKLAAQLAEAGTLSRDDARRVDEAVSRTGCREEAALLELSLLDAKSLVQALKDQTRARLVQCFAWTSGEFETDPDEAPPQDAQPFRVELVSAVQEGVETHWRPEQVIAALGPRMNLYPSRTDRFARIAARLRTDEPSQGFLARVDGKQTLWSAIQVASTPRALATAYVLDATDALAYGEEPKSDGVAQEVVREIEIVTVDPAAGPGHDAQARAGDAPAAGAAPSDSKAAAVAQEIVDKHARLAELDFYEILGVESDVAERAIKKAYLAAAKRYHPDALARLQLDEETRRQAGEVFAKIGRAHAILTNAAQRREYDASLSTDESGLDANRIASAEGLYRKGEILIRQGNFRAAHEFVSGAVALWPEECDYQSALGWVLYRKTPSEPEAAREALEKAVSLDSNNATAVFRLGVVLRALGHTERADAALARARQLDPNVS